jgi:holo-[acyl-carrier protein] synthase
MEVRNDPGGQPRVLMCGGVKDLAQTLRVSDILVSISHCRAYATAYALAVRGTTPAPVSGGPPPVREHNE